MWQFLRTYLAILHCVSSNLSHDYHLSLVPSPFDSIQQFLLTEKTVLGREYESIEIVRCTDQPLGLDVIVYPEQEKNNFVQFGLVLSDHIYAQQKKVSQFVLNVNQSFYADIDAYLQSFPN